jgi:hypothetical protein
MDAEVRADAIIRRSCARPSRSWDIEGFRDRQRFRDLQGSWDRQEGGR